MKPKVFIASSVEGLDIAKSLQINLEHSMEVTIWSQGIFELSEYALVSLTRALDNNDFGIFVFSADDQSIIRDKKKPIVRDNVIFELGLFVGKLGRFSNFIVKPRSINLHIPTDLYGLTIADYDDKRADGNLEAALGSSSTRIERQIYDLFNIEYPSNGHHGENILSEDFEEMKCEKPFSFKAVLKNNQSLKIRIISESEDNGLWTYRINQVDDWKVDRFDTKNNEQWFHLNGPTESDLEITFQIGAKVKIEYYENSDNRATRSKFL